MDITELHDNESMEEFITVLYELSEHCEFMDRDVHVPRLLQRHKTISLTNMYIHIEILKSMI